MGGEGEDAAPALSSVSPEELARIEAEVRTWPPLTAEQKTTLRRLFSTASTSMPTSGAADAGRLL